MRLNARLWGNAACLLVLAALAGLSPVRARAEATFRAIDAEPLDAVPANALVLHDGWSLGEEAVVGDAGDRFSSVQFHPHGWYRTSVPTTVLGALVRQGVYPDPYIGANDDAIPDASAPNSPWSKPWWFRCAFRIPATQAGKTIWLNLDGINYRAAIWINGREIANEQDTAGMFRRLRFDVTSSVHAGEENALAIRIFPVDQPGIPGYRRPGTDPRFQQNVTEMSALGWDWVATARDRNMGIWQHVWIDFTGPAAVTDPAAFTDVDLPGGKQAAVTVRFTLQNTDTTKAPVDVLAEIQPVGFEGPVIRVKKRLDAQPAGSREVILTPSEFPALVMKNPRLWWPHGYGDQPLYRLTVQLDVSGRLSSRRTTEFGVRKIGYFYNPKEFAHTLTPIPDGMRPEVYPPLKTARVFTVNGQPIRMAGGSMVPDFLMTWNAQQYRDQVRMMTEGNHTVVRVWGGGIILPDAFYAEADRRGLLVWQDLARGSVESSWGKTEAETPAVNKDLYLANIRDTILRLRGRTSLFVWCGTNESAMQTDIGKALQNELLPRLDGTRPWLPSTSTEPPWATEPLGTRSFGPYSTEDIRYYFDQYAHSPDFRFKNEIGLESVPRLNSIEKAIPGAGALSGDGSWVSKALLDHGLPVRNLSPRISEAIGTPVSLADFVSMSELLNAQSYRAIFEAANKNRPRNPGTMVWMTNAAWLDCMFQLYDWYLDPTASYYAVKSASRPLHVQYAADDHTLQVVSTRTERLHLHVKATLTSAAGVPEAVKDYAVTVAADATTNVGPAPAEVMNGKLHFLALDLQDEKGNELDRLVTWVQNDERWSELLNLAPVKVSAHVVGVAHQTDGETRYRIRVANHGNVPAIHVWVELTHGQFGQEILPSFWSDNALTLLPGEERHLTVAVKDKSGSVDHLMVEGFNVLPQDFAISSGAKAGTVQLEVVSLDRATKNGQNIVTVKITQTGETGSRWNTWPMTLNVDGSNVRTFRVALHGTQPETVEIPTSFGTGSHKIEVGQKSLDVGSH